MLTMEKEDMVMMEKEDESHHSSVLVFYDTELSKKTITQVKSQLMIMRKILVDIKHPQLGAVCSAGEFNR